MSIKTEGVHAGEFLLSEANGARSRENIVIVTGAGKLAAGTLLAMITAANAMVPTAAGGNTGNGTIGSIAISSEAVSGTYLLTITEAAANGGTFEVTSSSGAVIGTGEVGVAFEAAGIGFTLADGSTDFAEGDAFTLAVTANLDEYVPYDDDGTDDGRRTASAILYGPVDATDVDVMAVGIVRDAEVTERLLTGLDANGRADLSALGIVIRP
ncbi:MAG TPA: head decoration protein [Pseudomonas sp.]|nr:head decoration protein [Paracoccaceae bacterium]MAQ51700.1 head decoration protein [Pseudomonas sp.]MBB51200.1 head decoration protein [Pseudomonadales bacterium]MBB52282.1 head decoration protein [Pseudomonadales bacterium]HCA24843.1 head decoration protein [Pseudomonas sp.]|tara:strand:+ start:5572 stop:6207 length:636 start_codon:yes stop_codon:yes gene_type:complete